MFSLVELIVVIAIISILASMLLAALGKAKRTAVHAACMNNLKQLGVGSSLYAGEQDGYFAMLGGMKSNGDSTAYTWHGGTNQEVFTTFAVDYLSQTKGTPQSQLAPILYCPAGTYDNTGGGAYYLANIVHHLSFDEELGTHASNYGYSLVAGRYVEGKVNTRKRRFDPREILMSELIVGCTSSSSGAGWEVVANWYMSPHNGMNSRPVAALKENAHQVLADGSIDTFKGYNATALYGFASNRWMAGITEYVGVAADNDKYYRGGN